MSYDVRKQHLRQLESLFFVFEIKLLAPICREGVLRRGAAYTEINRRGFEVLKDARERWTTEKKLRSDQFQ